MSALAVVAIAIGALLAGVLLVEVIWPIAYPETEDNE